MADDIRTRIAKVLYEDWWHGSWSFNEPPRWEKLSDAARDGWLRKGDLVIRELGLRPETAHAWSSYDRTLRVTGTRYVTDWSGAEPPYCTACGRPHLQGQCQRG